MSVNYETKIVRGWRIPAGTAHRINELTNYKYENEIHRCNAYSDYDKYRYFGEEIDTIPCGTAESMTMIFANCIATEGLDWDAIRQEVASDLECYKAVAGEPNLWIMNCVL